MLRILKIIDSRLGGNSLFIFFMAVGAGLSLARGFAAAVILPASEFGLYSLLVAVAAFASSIAGFGKIEETRKLFPRMAVDGHSAEIAPMADRLTLLVGLRLTLIGIPLCIASSILLSAAWAMAILATLMLIFGVAWCTIMASALRAGQNLTLMGTSAAIRAAMTAAFALAGAYKFGFSGAVSGEAIGAIFGAVLMRQHQRTIIVPNASNSTIVNNEEKAFSIEGIYFFVGVLAAAVPIYLGRILVVTGFSSNILGTYSFLGLLVFSILTVLGISDQITGPTFIKIQRKGVCLKNKFFSLIIVLLCNIIIITTICTIFFGIIFISQLSYFRLKYDLQLNIIIPISLYCIFQITSTVDWFLQAHDLERILAAAAVIQMIVFLIISLIVIISGMSFVWILWTHALAKAIQLAIQCFALNEKRRIS